MSNNKQLKKELTNAKARFKAASKKLEKLEPLEDNQAIASAQAKSTPPMCEAVPSRSEGG